MMDDQAQTHPSEDAANQYAERVQDVIAPVAVAVISAEPLRIQRQPSRSFTTGSVNIRPLENPCCVIGPNAFRERLLIVNDGTETVFIGPQRDTLTPAGGYPLASHAQIELFTRRAVYATAPDASDPVPLHFLAENVDG